MTQLVLNIETPGMVTTLKKLVSALEGVSIAPTVRRKKTGMQLALEDKAKGRIVTCANKEELFQNLGL